MKTAIIYDGSSRDAAIAIKQLQPYFPAAELRFIEHMNSTDFEAYDLLLLGTTSWKLGESQENWIDALPRLQHADLHGRHVAIFVLGHRHSYPGTFIVRGLHIATRRAGASLVGCVTGPAWCSSLSTEHYCRHHFPGLPLNPSTEGRHFRKRILAWSCQVMTEARRSAA
jgi:flavodoxin I